MTNPLSAALTVSVQSHSDPRVKYTVTFPVTEQPYCTCKGYGYRRSCSHITEAANILLDEFLKQQHELPVPALNNASQLQHYCTGCGTPLVGTHALLTQCAACYRHDTLGSQSQPHAPVAKTA